MRTIYAEYNINHDSIDVYTSAGYMLRIDCWEAEKNLKTTYYNSVQHPYNKIKRKFDIKKALHKRHLEYLRFYNCRTTG